jgi:hypothetical protein
LLDPPTFRTLLTEEFASRRMDGLPVTGEFDQQHHGTHFQASVEIELDFAIMMGSGMLIANDTAKPIRNVSLGSAISSRSPPPILRINQSFAALLLLMAINMLAF